MIELFAIYKFCVYFGKRLRAKGRMPTPWQLLFVAMWFVFEVIGGIMGAVITGNVGGGMYVCALLGAVCAAVVMHLVIKSMPDLRQPAEVMDGLNQ